MDKQEADEFVAQTNITFSQILDSNSIKSNILILSKNFQSLSKYLANLKAFTVFLYNLIDIDGLVAQVLANIQSSKTVLLIDSLKNIGEIDLQTVNGVIYQLVKTDNYIIQITIPAQTTWNVDNLIVQVKNIQGIIVYPVIATKDNMITIYFADGITTNYKTFFI